MLITRGFGACDGGSGPGDPVYVPITDVVPVTDKFGERNTQASVRVPSLSSVEAIINPPDISTNAVDTDLDIAHFVPKITTSVPKV